MIINYKWEIKVAYNSPILKNDINENNVVIPKDYFKNIDITKIVEQAIKDDLKMSYNVKNPTLINPTR